MIQLKLTFSVLVFLFLNHFCQGQTLVTKEFDENEYICSYHHFEGVDLYATFDSDNNEIKIYDAFHNVQTSLIYDPDNYYNMLYVYGLSKDVFNSDNNIEFLVFKVSADGNTHKVVLINEHNKVLQEFDNYALIRAIGNKNYIVESTSETNIDTAAKQARINKTDKIHELKGKFRRIIY